MPDKLCCPRCPGDNEFLEYTGTRETIDLPQSLSVLWIVQPEARRSYLHQYRCVKCGYRWEFASPFADPEAAPHDRPIPLIPRPGRILGLN